MLHAYKSSSPGCLHLHKTLSQNQLGDPWASIHSSLFERDFRPFMCTSASIPTRHLPNPRLSYSEDKRKLAMLGNDCQHAPREYDAKEQLSSAAAQCDEDPTERYEILSDLGGGAYGTVYKAKDRNNDNIVALKKISVQEDPDIPGYPPFVLREVANLRRLSSDKNIVR